MKAMFRVFAVCVVTTERKKGEGRLSRGERLLLF